MLIIAFLLFLSASCQKPQDESTSKHDKNTVIDDIDVLEETKNILLNESSFHQPEVSYNEISGLTYDGILIDPETGQLLGFPRKWSAASKEALHIQLLSMTVAGNEKTTFFLSPENKRQADEIALDLLDKKITSYETFNEQYPGFAGFLPWFLVSEEGLEPAEDWQNRVPGLDNGQLAWALFQADYTLSQAGHHQLAKRYRNHWQLMAENAVLVFYEPEKDKIRAETAIAEPTATPFRAGYSNNIAGYFLDDPYEGELMVLFMILLGNWEDKTIAENVWTNRKMEVASYETATGESITVRKGHWYSSHEMWNFLVLPYRDVPLINEIFLNGEKARTYHSAENDIPGLFASAHHPVDGYDPPFYASAVGIEELAAKQVKHSYFVVPYASFPVIIADQEVGLAWYRIMTDAPRMQGPYGTTETITSDGKKIAPILTWDGKVLTVAALIADEMVALMGEAMQNEKIYEDFINLVSQAYEEVFGAINDLQGISLSLALPTAAIPWSHPDFAASTLSEMDVDSKDKNVVAIIDDTDSELSFYPEENLIETMQLWPGGDISFEQGPSVLLIKQSKGWLWSKIDYIDVSEKPILILELITNKSGTLWLELKNEQDQAVAYSDRIHNIPKIKLEIPDTGGELQRVIFDLSDLLIHGRSHTAAIVAFSDPTLQVYIEYLALTTEKALQDLND